MDALKSEMFEQIELLCSRPYDDSPVMLTLNDTVVPVRLSYSDQCTSLLISFHGASDRQRRTPPFFVQKFKSLGQNIAQLRVSDPSLAVLGNFSMAWYAGHEGFRSQDHLYELIKTLQEQCKFERIVFFGSSGGGFAALYFSSLFAGSVALAGVPQTNMHSYYSGHIRRYMEACWPSLNSEEELAVEICTNLCDWYATPRPNTVIYLQSAGDHFHTRTQFAPFLASIAQVKDARFIAHSGFWGRLGHSGAVTPECFLPWLRASFSSPSIEVDDLLQTHYSLTQSRTGTGEKLGAAPHTSLGEGWADKQKIADLLREYHLRQPMEK